MNGYPPPGPACAITQARSGMTKAPALGLSKALHTGLLRGLPHSYTYTHRYTRNYKPSASPC